jgi:alanine dehydrogenase
VLLSQTDLKVPGHQCQVIADVSCDINGPIAATIKASTIQDPFFGYNKETGEVCDWSHPSAIMMMTIDNLPCELPRDASEDFGNELLQSVIPNLLVDNHPMIEGATETKNGELTPPFQYLSDYAKG